MQPFDKIKEYSHNVCNQIRWKKAHNVVAQEIENHICDQRDAYIAQGEDESSATENAILQMGDPISVGMELDKTHKPKAQWTIIILAMLMFAIGFMIRTFLGNTSYSLFDLNIIFPSVLAIGVFWGAYFLDFSILGKHPKALYWVLLIIGYLGLFLSSSTNGRVFFLNGRLSVSLEYLSLLYPIAFSALIYSLRNKGYLGIILCGIGYTALAVVLLFIPTFSWLILFTISAAVLLCVSVVKGWFNVDKKIGLSLVLIPIVLVIAYAIFCIFNRPYLADRLNIALNPHLDPQGGGYVSIMIRELLANAQFIGKGDVPQEYSRAISSMPLFDTDYFLTYLIHNLGWIVFFVLAVLFCTFIVVGLIHCINQKSVLGLLVSLSVMLTFTFQTITYIASNLGYNLFSVLSLPLVSYGNTALLINMALIGIMLSVFRNGDIVKDKISQTVDQNPLFMLENGKLIITFKK